jgi:hypothetical protein
MPVTMRPCSILNPPAGVRRQNTMPCVARARKGTLRRPLRKLRGRPCSRAHYGRRIFFMPPPLPPVGWCGGSLPSLLPAPGGPSAAPAAVDGGFWLGFISWGCLCLVLFLFRVHPVVPVLWLGLCLAAGFGLAVRCLAALVGLRLRPVCSCRSAHLRWRRLLRVVFRLWAGGFGCVPALPVRLCSRLAVCRFRLLWSRWRCLSACLLALRV